MDGGGCGGDDSGSGGGKYVNRIQSTVTKVKGLQSMI